MFVTKMFRFLPRTKVEELRIDYATAPDNFANYPVHRLVDHVRARQ